MTSRCLSFLIFLTLGVTFLYATGQHADNEDSGYSAEQRFKVGSSKLSPDKALQSFVTLADSLYKSGTLASIEIEGTASPEGPIRLNRKLSRNRAEAVKVYLTTHSSIPSSLISTIAGGENWIDIERLISKRNDLPINVITDIVNNCQDRNTAERRLRALSCWPTIRDEIFPLLRRSQIILRLTDNTEIELIISEENTITPPPAEPQPEPEPEQKPTIEPVIESEPEPEPEPEIEAIIEPTIKPADCQSGWHLESNALEWGLLIANIGAERDLGCHWSAMLSLHYSAFNYMTSTRKFRTFIFRPEARYWLEEGHHGMFIEGHLQMASYNFALSGWEYRIQDVDGKTPALGGGLGIGYRLPVGKSGHWALQAQAGIGVYHLKYNRFENRINGSLVDTRSRTWWGIDNVAVSVVYHFNIQER